MSDGIVKDHRPGLLQANSENVKGLFPRCRAAFRIGPNTAENKLGGYKKNGKRSKKSRAEEA